MLLCSAWHCRTLVASETTRTRVRRYITRGYITSYHIVSIQKGKVSMSKHKTVPRAAELYCTMPMRHKPFPSILAPSWLSLARIVDPGIVSANGYTTCHFNEIHSDDVYNMMVVNCQVHTVCLGIVSSIVVPSSSHRLLSFGSVHTDHVVISASASSWPLSSAPPAASLLSSRSSLALSPSLYSFSMSSYHDLSIQLTIRSLAIGSML